MDDKKRLSKGGAGIQRNMWRLPKRGDKEFIGAVVLNKSGEMIADCNIFGTSREDAENLANARLAAAAPDMFLTLVDIAINGCPRHMRDSILKVLSAALGEDIKDLTQGAAPAP